MNKPKIWNDFFFRRGKGDKSQTFVWDIMYFNNYTYNTENLFPYQTIRSLIAMASSKDFDLNPTTVAWRLVPFKVNLVGEASGLIDKVSLWLHGIVSVG